MRARRSFVFVLPLLAHCSQPMMQHDAGPDSDLVHSYTEPRCSTPGLVPFRDGMGGNACDQAGSGMNMPMGMWPDTSDLMAPIAYVQAGATATGADGSMAHPYPDITTALSMMPLANAIVLAAGNYPIPNTITVNSGMVALEIRGAGSIMGGTTLSPMQRAPVITATGAMTQLTISRLAITFDGTTATDTQAIGVQSTAGAALFLRDVAIDNAYDAALATGSVLDIGDVTISGSLHRGVSLVSATDGTRSDGSISNTLVRDGLGQGVVSEGAQLAMVHSAVVRNLRGGLIVRGGDPTMPMSLDTVTVADNSIVGFSIAGAGALMTVTQLLATGMQASSDGVGGDGVYIGPGASVTMDMGIMGDNTQGTGSAMIANGRAGVLVNGDATMPAPMGGNLQTNGALVASNHGGGLIVQNSASVPSIAFALVAANVGVGIASTTQGSIGTIQSSQILQTTNGTITTGVGDIRAGDGLSVAEAASSGALAINGVEFSNNARFAAVFTGGAVMLSSTHGTGNAYGIGNYGANLTMSGANDVSGSMSMPASAPDLVRGAMLPPP
jgi:hypothetical protein